MKATSDLLAENGDAVPSLSEAARRANVSRGVAYLHFRGRDQMLNEARAWISEQLDHGLTRFDADASLHDRTFHNTRLVLSHPEAPKLMITAAMAGVDLDRQHPLYKLVMRMLQDMKASGRARVDMDVEVVTYIMFGAIASTIMLGAQRKGDDVDVLAERFTKEWNWILQQGIFARKTRASRI